MYANASNNTPSYTYISSYVAWTVQPPGPGLTPFIQGGEVGNVAYRASLLMDPQMNLYHRLIGPFWARSLAPSFHKAHIYPIFLLRIIYDIEGPLSRVFLLSKWTEPIFFLKQALYNIISGQLKKRMEHVTLLWKAWKCNDRGMCCPWKGMP